MFVMGVIFETTLVNAVAKQSHDTYRSLEPSFVSSYFARKIGNRCSDLQVQTCMEIYYIRERCLYNSNETESECMI